MLNLVPGIITTIHVQLEIMTTSDTQLPPSTSAPGAMGQWTEGHFEEADRVLNGHGKRRLLAYRLYLPANPRAAHGLPLLVMLHGCKQNSQIFAEGTQMNRLADRHCFGVLYPEQSSVANSARCWNWFDSESLDGEGEAGMIARLIDDVANRHPIDRTRIYVAGMSAGGAMARNLAIRHGVLFAACAVHSGVMYRAANSMIQALVALQSGSRASPDDALRMVGHDAARPAPFVPTLVIHGDRDNTVNPINAGQLVQQARTLAAREDPQTSLIGPTEREVLDGGRVYVLRDYSRQGRLLIREVMIKGLGHAWSGGDARHPFNDATGPSASELIWEFVSHHRRKSETEHATLGTQFTRFLNEMLGWRR
jgi:poly(hydroxyalkanoate) depolymerase family esterase